MDAGWHPDPTTRHELRYHDGAAWTEHVATGGAQSTDVAGVAQANSPNPQSTVPGDVLSAAMPPPTGAPSATTQPATQPETRAAAAPAQTGGGISGSLLDGDAYAEREGGRVSLQNPRLLKIELGPDVLIKRGSMVAYQGAMTFTAVSEGGGMGRMVKRALATDNAKMATASGSGELFLADDAHEIHLLEMNGGGLVVNGSSLLALESGMSFRTRSLGTAGVLAGGLFVMDVQGQGWAAITAHGTPVRLNTDAPTFVDPASAVCWSSTLTVNLRKQALGFNSLRSGEAFQLEFSGQGFVLVQASEGPSVPVHSHS